MKHFLNGLLNIIFLLVVTTATISAQEFDVFAFPSPSYQIYCGDSISEMNITLNELEMFSPWFESYMFPDLMAVGAGASGNTASVVLGSEEIHFFTSTGMPEPFMIAGKIKVDVDFPETNFETKVTSTVFATLEFPLRLPCCGDDTLHTAIDENGDFALSESEFFIVDDPTDYFYYIDLYPDTNPGMMYAGTNGPEAFCSLNCPIDGNCVVFPNEGGTGTTGGYPPGGGLPIELIEFEALRSFQGALLSWTTGSEMNNKGFHVQRSEDGFKWENIGFVDGAGTTVNKKQYSFSDVTPINGSLYYRLQQEDFDGRLAISKVVGLDQGIMESGVTIFPNPVLDNYFFVSKSDLSDNFEIKVYDHKGGLILSRAQMQESTVNTTNWPAGVYLVETRTKLQRQRFKIVVEK